MKKIILSFMLIFAGYYAFSQQVTIDERLYAKYHESDLQAILQNHPNDIEYMNWLLDNSYVIKQLHESEYNISKYPKLKYFDKETKMAGAEVTEYNPENFNIMEFDFEIDYKNSNAYLIGNTGKLLVFYAGQDLTTLFNNYRKTTYGNE